MEVVNAIELDGVLFFIGGKPSETVMRALIKYDGRFSGAEVLGDIETKRVKRALTLRSAQACNYKLA